MSIVDELRKKKMFKEAADLEALLDSEADDSEGEEDSEEIEDDFAILLDEEDDGEDGEVSEEYDGPSRPSIAVYAERMADRLEDFVRRDLVTDAPAEILAEILAHIVKNLEAKGYHSLQAPSLDANRTARVRQNLLRAVTAHHKRIPDITLPKSARRKW